jgi:peroxiredoxin Q/BCP
MQKEPLQMQLPQGHFNVYTKSLPIIRTISPPIQVKEIENRTKTCLLSSMITKGKKIDTDFTLQIVQDGEKKEIAFSDLLDRPTIISVYMRNNTGSCDKQNQSLAGHSGWFEKKGYNLVALSKDTCRSHKNYAEKLGINYTLASDPEFKFAGVTDSVVEKKMFGRTFDAPSRSAFVIDTDGTVLEIIEKVNTKAHAEELKELVESL